MDPVTGQWVERLLFLRLVDRQPSKVEPARLSRGLGRFGNPPMGRTHLPRALGRSGHGPMVRGRCHPELAQEVPAQELVAEPAPADVVTEPAPAIIAALTGGERSHGVHRGSIGDGRSVVLAPTATRSARGSREGEAVESAAKRSAIAAG